MPLERNLIALCLNLYLMSKLLLLPLYSTTANDQWVLLGESIHPLPLRLCGFLQQFVCFHVFLSIFSRNPDIFWNRISFTAWLWRNASAVRRERVGLTRWLGIYPNARNERWSLLHVLTCNNSDILRIARSKLVNFWRLTNLRPCSTTLGGIIFVNKQNAFFKSILIILYLNNSCIWPGMSLRGVLRSRIGFDQLSLLSDGLLSIVLNDLKWLLLSHHRTVFNNMSLALRLNSGWGGTLIFKHLQILI